MIIDILRLVNRLGYRETVWEGVLMGGNFSRTVKVSIEKRKAERLQILARTKAKQEEAGHCYENN